LTEGYTARFTKFGYGLSRVVCNHPHAAHAHVGRLIYLKGDPDKEY